MSDLAPSIFVISNPEDRGEILAPLMEAGFREILAGEGSDETLSFCERLRPDVVVLCAGLDHGDARTLVSAMRDGPHGSVVRIVLIGEIHGPIRNALDVADLAVDRFLGRPLSPKALVFCVRICAEAAMAARMAAADARAAAAVPMAVPVAMAVPVPVPMDDDDDDDGEPEIEIEVGREIDDDEEPEIELDTGAPELDAGLPELDTGAPELDAGPGAAPTSDWDEPGPPAWREPTVILPDSNAEPLDAGATQPVLAVHGEPVPLAVLPGMAPERAWADTDTGLPLSGARLSGEDGPLADDDFSGDGIGEGIDDDLGPGLDGEDLASASELDAHIADLDDGADGGGEFARALRRKMSAMAERLFPGQRPGAAAVSQATSGGVPDEKREDSLDGPVMAAGPIRRGEADAILLIERAFRQRFTGRISFCRGQVRKSILFENGRPVFASSNLPEDRLGALLYREGKISGVQNDHGYLQTLESGKRMAEVLVEMGYLKRRELLPTVRRHLEDLVYSVFAWDAGEYEMTAGSFAAGERIRLSRHPVAMILEGVRRKLDQDTLVALVGGPATVLEIVDDRQRKTVVSVADLSPAERKLIASFDGERNLDAIVRSAGIGLLAVYQLAYGLIVMKAAQVVRRVDAEGAGHPDGEDEVLIDRQRILAKLSLVGDADYFALLGVRRDATPFEIQRSYEAARRDYASETFCPEVRRALAAEIAEIREVLDEAYRVLRDDSLRNAYLRNLRD